MRHLSLCFVSLCLLLLSTMVCAQTLPSQSQPAREPVPAPAALKDATALVTEVFKSDLAAARAPEQKEALCHKLLAAAVTEKGASRYALLTRASDLAAETGAVDDCDAALAVLEAAYDLDTVKLRADACLALARNVHLPAARRKLVLGMSATIHAALAADRFDIAKSLSQVAVYEAQTVGDRDLTQLAAGDLRAVGECETAYAEIKPALAILADKPADPDANLKVGKYRCFIKGDWKNGLPLLALGSDPALKTLAEKEIQIEQQLFDVTTADARTKLGDGWWDIAQTLRGPALNNTQSRAAKWYTEAQPALTGLQKAKVDQRLAKVAADIARANGDDGWTVLFRSADPTLWNTATNKGHDAYAIPLEEAPKGVQFLRLAVPNGDFIIVPMTNERLGIKSLSDKERVGWEGRRNLDYKGYHLGIFDRELPRPVGSVSIHCHPKETSEAGWGFGNHAKLDDQQGYGWAGREIGPTVFEISVKTTPLTDDEKKRLAE